MYDLKQMIKSEFEKDPRLSGKIAKKMNVNREAIYKFLKKDSPEVKNFNDIIVMTRELFPDKEFEIMYDFAMTLDPNKKTARYCLEYSETYKLTMLRDDLLTKMLKATNSESKEWAMVYDINSRFLFDDYDSIDLFRILDDLKVKSIEMKTLVNIIRFFNYYDLGMLGNMSSLLPIIESLILDIKDDFIRDRYSMRLLHIFSEVKLHEGELNAVRSIESKIGDDKISYEYACLMLSIGNSYLFDDFEKAKKYLDKSLNCYSYLSNKRGQYKSKCSLNFLYSYWSKKPKYLDFNNKEISHVHEVAFYYAKFDSKKGLEILKNMNIDKLNYIQLGFHYFYLGLITKNKDDFYNSIYNFNKASEKFYKKAPINELIKLGENNNSLLQVLLS